MAYELDELKEEYQDEVYRPGEEIPQDLTEEEWTERRKDIAAAFEQANEEMNVN